MSALIFPAKAVAQTLQLSTQGPAPPAAHKEEGILFWYGGWSLADLAATPAGRRHMWPQSWFQDLRLTIPHPAYFQVHPLPESLGKTRQQQKQVLEAGGLWTVPAVLMATAVVLMYASGDTDIFGNAVLRCLEVLTPGYHIAINTCPSARKLSVHRVCDVSRTALAVACELMDEN